MTLGEAMAAIILSIIIVLIGVILTIMATVPAETAMSNISSYIRVITVGPLPSWAQNSDADQVALLIGILMISLAADYLILQWLGSLGGEKSTIQTFKKLEIEQKEPFVKLEFNEKDITEEFANPKLTPLLGSNQRKQMMFPVRVTADRPIESVSVRVIESDPITGGLEPYIPFELPLAYGNTQEEHVNLDEGVITKFALAEVNVGDAVSDIRFFRKGHDPISIVTAQERLDPDIAPVISRKCRIKLGVWAGGRKVAELWMKFTWSGKERIVRAVVAADYESREIKASLT